MEAQLQTKVDCSFGLISLAGCTDNSHQWVKMDQWIPYLLLLLPPFGVPYGLGSILRFSYITIQS